MERNGVLETVAVEGMTIPNGEGTFNNLFDPVVSHGDALFFGTNADASYGGLFLYNGSSIRALIDSRTNVPGSATAFSPFDFGARFDYSDGKYIFRSLSGALYFGSGQAPIKLIGPGDHLGGQIGDQVMIGAFGAISGNQVGFDARFTDGSTATYLVTVPEPTAALLLLLGALSLHITRLLTGGRTPSDRPLAGSSSEYQM